MFRLWTRHAPLNARLRRINEEPPATFVYCIDSDETVLTISYAMSSLWKHQNHTIASSTNIHNTLYGSTTQLQRTPIYNMSAMNGRDKIVRNLEDRER